VPAAAAETKHGLEDADRGRTGPAATAEAAQAKQPDIVLSPPQEAAAAPAPRTTDITAVEQRFKKAEADALLSRGDEFFAAGDLASARIFYEYAAASGNGAAALRLGGTFDPAFLARIRIGRIQGDIPSALYWYRRARDLGNGDAEILLKRMEMTAQ
jgi:TPR repeat protein